MALFPLEHSWQNSINCSKPFQPTFSGSPHMVENPPGILEGGELIRQVDYDSQCNKTQNYIRVQPNNLENRTVEYYSKDPSKIYSDTNQEVSYCGILLKKPNYFSKYAVTNAFGDHIWFLIVNITEKMKDYMDKTCAPFDQSIINTIKNLAVSAGSLPTLTNYNLTAPTNIRKKLGSTQNLTAPLFDDLRFESYLYSILNSTKTYSEKKAAIDDAEAAKNKIIDIVTFVNKA